ncbi:DUF6069 family protein [Spirillospora sp. NPDC047279]|uniref:DUF6069 family protein n=1 Tax=Spirillospora sp. NPDC047279 TaxID=3155478 RepID=UPI0033C39F1D
MAYNSGGQYPDAGGRYPDAGGQYPEPGRYPDPGGRYPETAPAGPPARGSRRPPVNAGRLWAGGVATAVVAAAVGIVGLFIARGLFDIPVWLPDGEYRVMDATAARIAGIGALAALAATGILHLLLVTTPAPRQFFVWIVMLATLIAILWPFTTGMSLSSKLAGASIAFATGLAIGMLLTSVAASAVRGPARA